MGLASYGDPTRYAGAFDLLCAIGPDASLALDMRYFAFHRHPTKSFTPRLEALLGPARAPGALLDPHDGADGTRWADIAAAL